MGKRSFFPAGRKADDFIGVFSIEKFCKSKIAGNPRNPGPV
jgi:hypothetical protein